MKDYAVLESIAAKSNCCNDVIVQLSSESLSLRTTYGLWLKKSQPTIQAPEVESLLEYPAGFDFVYNFTQALDGNVHFVQRGISMSFLCDRPKSQWESIRSALETAMQGQRLTFWFSYAPEIRYQGFFEVSLTPGVSCATVSIDVTCAP